MRQANSTIRGYLYQFNKSIFEILTAGENDLITLEGVIEDIDIDSQSNTTSIQCKYHEDKKYQISSVAEPILDMICHFHECSVIGRNMTYKLYAYFEDNVDTIDKDSFADFISSTTNKDIILSYFHRIYTIQDERILQIANKSKKTSDDKRQLLDYYERNRSSLNLCISLDNFWSCFKYLKAEQFDVLRQKIIEKFSEVIDKETAENLYYPNAFSYISNLSAEADVNQRKVTKKGLFDFLVKQKSVLISRWILVALDREKLLKNKKKHLSSYFSLNPDIRAFIFSYKFNELNSDSIIEFIHTYISKYFKKPKLQKPPIFIFDDRNETLLQKSIIGLYQYQKYVNNGMVGDSFIEDSFINNKNCKDPVSCKMTLLGNIKGDLLEQCNVNQLYIIGNLCNISDELQRALHSHNYFVENLDIENVNELKYLVGLENILEE
ncbi:MAG: hypothetical protein K2J89_05675 [Clostridia bacterium]|nr:hypothetical protein [Clostridia bacterium]